MKLNEYSIGFIGFGHMAQILFSSLDRAKMIQRSHVLFISRDPKKMKKREREFGITSSTLETLTARSDLLFLCVRPQDARGVLADLSRLGVSQKKILSIVAGLKLAAFEKFLGPVSVIRAMPNLPSEVGEGMTTLVYGARSGLNFQSAAVLLFKSIGEVVELPEEFMDLATGMAGSSPAYIFSLIESVARLGEREGIPYEKAIKLAAQTFLGSARVLLREGADVPELIQRIAVPNGTTEAGLKVFKELEIGKRFEKVIEAVARRSKEITRELDS